MVCFACQITQWFHTLNCTYINARKYMILKCIIATHIWVQIMGKLQNVGFFRTVIYIGFSERLYCVQVNKVRGLNALWKSVNTNVRELHALWKNVNVSKRISPFRESCRTNSRLHRTNLFFVQLHTGYWSLMVVRRAPYMGLSLLALLQRCSAK